MPHSKPNSPSDFAVKKSESRIVYFVKFANKLIIGEENYRNNIIFKLLYRGIARGGPGVPVILPFLVTSQWHFHVLKLRISFQPDFNENKRNIETINKSIT